MSVEHTFQHKMRVEDDIIFVKTGIISTNKYVNLFGATIVTMRDQILSRYDRAYSPLTMEYVDLQVCPK